MMCLLLCFVCLRVAEESEEAALFFSWCLTRLSQASPLKDFGIARKFIFGLHVCLSEAKLLVPQLRRRICEGVNDLCCLEMQVRSQEITPQGHGYWLVEFLQVQGNVVERVE